MLRHNQMIFDDYTKSNQVSLSEIFFDGQVQGTPITSLLSRNKMVKQTSKNNAVEGRYRKVDDSFTGGKYEGSIYEQAKSFRDRTFQNYNEIFKTTASVSCSAQGYAVENEELKGSLKHIIEQRAYQVKRDIESQIIIGKGKLEDEESGRQMHGIINFPNLVEDGNIIDIEGEAISHDLINYLQSLLSKNGQTNRTGKGDILVCSPEMKMEIDKLYAKSEVTNNHITLTPGANKEVGINVSKIVTSFGSVSVIYSPDIEKDTIMVFNSDKFYLNIKRPLMVRPVNTGHDAITQEVVAELCVMGNPYAVAVAKGLKEPEAPSFIKAKKKTTKTAKTTKASKEEVKDADEK